MWLHVDRVVIGHQIAESARRGTPRGNLSDLYPRWLGARELLFHRRDPYSREVTEEIQAGYYGRALDPSRPTDPTDQQAFAYPLYTVFLLAPTVTLPFHMVRVIFFWLLLVLTIVSVILWLRFLRWNASRSTTAIFALLTLGTFAVVQGLKLQQLSLLVAFLFAASLALLAAGQLISAGVLLALAMIKPHLALPLVAWLMLWSAAAWQRRWKFTASFFICFGALVAGAEVLLPGWIPRFHAALLAYGRYATSGPLLQEAMPRTGAILLLLLLMVALAALCWHACNCEAQDELFMETTALVLAVTLVVLPTYPPYNQLLLLPGVLLLWCHWRELWRQSLALKVLLAAIALPLIWSWASAIALAAASFFTPAAQNYWHLPLWTSFVLPIPVVACLALLTSRTLFAKAHRSTTPQAGTID